MSVERCLPQGVFDFRAHVFECRNIVEPRVVQLDDMPAELRLNGLGYIAGLKLGDDIEEGFDHDAGAEPAKVAAVAGRGAGGVLARERGEIGAILKLGHQIERGVLGFDKDMRGLLFGLGFGGGILILVGRLNLGVAQLVAHHGFDRFGGDDGAALVIKQ